MHAYQYNSEPKSVALKRFACKPDQAGDADGSGRFVCECVCALLSLGFNNELIGEQKNRSFLLRSDE